MQLYQSSSVSDRVSPPTSVAEVSHVTDFDHVGLGEGGYDESEWRS